MALDITVRTVPAVHVALLTRKAPGFGPEHVGPVVGPMFPEVAGRVAQAGVAVDGPPLAEYAADESGDGSGALVTVAFPVPVSTTAVPGLEVDTLPGIDQAAVTVYHGAMTGIGEAWTAFMDRLTADGYVLTGACREVYLSEPGAPESEWDTELIQPVTAS